MLEGVRQLQLFRKLGLRFSQKEDEAKFKAHLEPWVVQGCVVTGAIYSVVTFMIGASIYASELAREDSPFRWDVTDPRTQLFATQAVCCGFAVMWSTIGLLWKWRGWFQTWPWELIDSILGVCIALSFVAVSPWYVAKLRGYDPDEVWLVSSSDAEKDLVIFFDMMTTCICLYIPIRSCILWISFLSTLFIFGVVVLTIGSPFPQHAYWNIMYTAILMTFGWLGAHRQEQHVRKEWCASNQVEEQRIQMDDTSALVDALRAAAKFLCDTVIELSQDLQVLDAEHTHNVFFGFEMQGKYFADVLAAGDQARFTNVLDQVASSQIPQCLSVTFMSNFGSLEANLLIVAVCRGKLRYLVGVRSEKLDPALRPACAQASVLRSGACGPSGPASSGGGSKKLSRQIVTQHGQVEELSRVDSTRTPLSLPTTSPSGRLFDSIRHHMESRVCSGKVDREFHDQIESIVTLGQQEHWLIDTEGFEIPTPQQILGKGGFGIVFAATLNGTPAAVKIAQAAKNSAVFHKRLPYISNELRILRRLRHPNIVMFFGACIDSSSGEISLVFEQLRGEPLHSFIGVPPERPDTRSRHHIILDVCSALRYLHTTSPCIVHGDLKAANVFVEFLSSRTPHAKLLDFGLSRLIEGRRVQSLGGTRLWEAPEIVADRKMRPSTAADIFSLGLLARFVVTGLRPEDRHLEPPVHVEVGLLKECSALCSECLQREAIHRPDMATIHAMVLAWRSSSDAAKYASNGSQTLALKGQKKTLKWTDALRNVRESLTIDGKAGALAKRDFANVSPAGNFLWIDTAADGYPVIACTHAFASISASMPLGASFLYWVPDAKRFEEWMQNCVNQQVNQYLSQEVVFTPPLSIELKTTVGRFKAICSCRLLIADFDDEDGTGAAMYVARMTMTSVVPIETNSPEPPKRGQSNLTAVVPIETTSSPEPQTIGGQSN